MICKIQDMSRHIFDKNQYLFCTFFLIALVNLSSQVFITPAPPNITLEGYKYHKDAEQWWIKMGANEDEASDITDDNVTTVLISRDGNDYSVLSRTVLNIVFICRASSPIFWTMDDAEPKVLTDIYTYTRVELDENSTNWEPIEFQSYLVLGNWASLTGQYTCQYSHNKTNNASVYTYFGYANDQDKSIIVTPKRKLTVGFNGKDSLVLPCRVSRNDINVTLLIKENNATSETNKTKSSKWISPAFVPEFIPKIGFIIDKSDTPNLPVSFKCGIKINMYFKESVTIHVQNEYLKKPKEFKYRNNKSGKANWKKRPYYDGIECCSNSSTSPKFHVVTCESQPHCDMIKKAYISIEKKTSSTPGLVPLSYRFEGEPCIHTGYEYYMELPFFLECVGDGIDVAGEYKTKFVSSSKEKIGFVSVSNGAIPEYSEDTTLRARISRVVSKNTSLETTLQELEKVDPEVDIFRGENYVFHCCGLHAYHAVGRIQRIGWKNGSTALLNERDADTDEWNPIYKDFCGFTVQLYSYRVDVNMSYFECIIPYWNKTRPFVKRMNMIVREYKEPILKLNNQTINITFDENQFGLLLLDCTTIQGDPVPEFKWTKNGFKVNRTDKFWSVVNDLRPDLPTSGSILLFMRAVKEIEGIYECVGGNEAGSARKTFSVLVKPRSYVDYWIAFFVFGGFFLFMIITAIKITIQEKRLGIDYVK